MECGGHKAPENKRQKEKLAMRSLVPPSGACTTPTQRRETLSSQSRMRRGWRRFTAQPHAAATGRGDRIFHGQTHNLKTESSFSKVRARGELYSVGNLLFQDETIAASNCRDTPQTKATFRCVERSIGRTDAFSARDFCKRRRDSNLMRRNVALVGASLDRFEGTDTRLPFIPAL